MSHDQFGSDFTEHSIAGILQKLRQEIKNRGMWQDFESGSIGANLLEVFSIYLAKHKFMQTLHARESMPTKAQMRSAVLEGFKILQYNPGRRVWSKVDLRFYLDSAHDEDIVIPRHTAVTDEDSGINFITQQRAIISEGETEVTTTAVQGTVQTIDRTSEGQSNMEIHIPSDIVAENGVTVLVDENGDGFTLDDRWQQLDSLLEALPDTEDYRSYKIESRTDETIDVIFGNGSQGKIPSAGTPIRVEYIETLGSDGIVVSSDTITQLQTDITDIAGNSVDVSVTNDSRTATGGSDKPSLEEIKKEAPEIFSVGESAVTRKDYQAIAEDEPSVLLANAVGERNSDPPDPSFADKLELYVIRERDQDGNPQPVTDEWAGKSGTGTLEDPNEGSFLFNLRKKSMLNAVNDVFEAGKVWFFVEGTAYVDPSVEPSKIKGEVTQRLRNLFLAENNVDREIGKPVRESDMEETVGAIPEVVYHHFKNVMFARNTMDSTSVDLTLTDFATQTNDYQIAPPIKPFTVRIYNALGDLIISDDGAGTLQAENSSEFQSGTIDYDPGTGNTFISMTLSSVPDEVWEFHFRSEDPNAGETLQDGDVLVNNSQYAIYDSALTSENTNIRFDFEE